VKIGDYGLSKFISASRRSGQTVSIGSVHYMAPEIAHGRYGHEVDQYALGIILCQMLTGRVPFDGESQGEILMKHLAADPDLGRLTEPYRSVVARLLDKDPRNRYPAVQYVLDELRALDPGMPGACPGSERANSCSDTEVGVKAGQPAAERRRAGRGRKPRFAKRPLIRFLAENSMEVSDIRRVIRALRKYPAQEVPGLLTAVQSMVEHCWGARDIEHLVRFLGRRPELDVPCIMALLPTLVEHDFDARGVEPLLSVLGEHPERGLSGKVTAVQDMVEHGVEAKDVEPVLRALAACSKHELAAKLSTVQRMIEHDVDARDIERILRALSEFPAQELAGVASMVKSMLENGVEARNIERVLCALCERPEHELADVVAAVQGMVEDGMEAEDIEKSVRDVV
jgi:hypothetical protein